MPLTGGAAASGLRPVVTLLTDFGRSEPFVGLVKAQVLRHCPAATLIDLTHDLPPFAIAAAAFWTERCHGWFPPGTVHLCIVDPGVGTRRRILLLEQGGHRFLAPDNGLLSGMAGRAGAVVRAVEDSFLVRRGLEGASATFHGRDLFAPLAGRLAAGDLDPAEVGPEVSEVVVGGATPPQITSDGIRGSILFADRFGNLFSNIETKSLVKWKKWQVRFAGQPLPWVRTYGEAPAGQWVALENAFGVVEIACVEGSAARELAPGADAEVEVRRIR